ncbi:Holliday junction branch migration DNA helicase RuvB [[Acholeplasma] multilocale]|uniref:Holliday junction branch migration DNA helicase RuvB n=1 Tax=[Acholeplasma] multilocale TaxID=264638 RepID=UPI00047C081C|nr:Holliday junction branch migration DNA helicase RuvB [[Acholeplasma] multilocale]
MSNQFRPVKWSEYLGQTKIIENLKIYVQAAIKQEKVLDHMIIHGPSGMGKTSLAYLIAKILKTKIHILNGPSIQKPSDLISVLSSIKEHHIVFIDEVHAVNKDIMELLYPVLEDNKLNIIIGKEYNSKVINIKLPAFTLITATTEINKIPYPLLNRFSINLELVSYTSQEIGVIAQNTAFKLDLPIDESICWQIAEYSRQTPRICINLIKRINDYYITGNYQIEDLESLNKILLQMGIYKFGITEQELRYLKILDENRVMGIEAASQILNVPIPTLITNIEPILLRCGLIVRGIRGRQITNKGIEYLKSQII